MEHYQYYGLQCAGQTTWAAEIPGTARDVVYHKKYRNGLLTFCDIAFIKKNALHQWRPLRDQPFRQEELWLRGSALPRNLLYLLLCYSGVGAAVLRGPGRRHRAERGGLPLPVYRPRPPRRHGVHHGGLQPLLAQRAPVRWDRLAHFYYYFIRSNSPRTVCSAPARSNTISQTQSNL